MDHVLPAQTPRERGRRNTEIHRRFPRARAEMLDAIDVRFFEGFARFVEVVNRHRADRQRRRLKSIEVIAHRLGRMTEELQLALVEALRLASMRELEREQRAKIEAAAKHRNQVGFFEISD